MRYEETEIQNVTIVSVHGDIIGDQSRRRLVDHVWALLAEDRTRIVLDVTGVRHVDSRGLGELIECFSASYWSMPVQPTRQSRSVPRSSLTDFR